MNLRICFVAFVMSMLSSTLVSCNLAYGFQEQPDYPILFDDFTYKSESTLFGRNEWTDLSGVTVAFSRMWYKWNWTEPDFDQSVRILFDQQSQIRLQTDQNHTFRWKNGFLPPIISSGFTAQTGTWASRVRFDDIARGIRSESPISQAFWTFSPNIACITDVTEQACPLKDKRWSEFNHEWNNYFSEAHVQYLANGGVVDGVKSATGSFMMRDPENLLGPGLTCNRFRDFLVEPIHDSEECMSWFVSNGQKRRFADLMIKYDGHDLIFVAIAWGHDSAAGADDGVMLKKIVTIGRRAQPMVSRFGMHGRTHEQCLNANIVNESCWIQDNDFGFSIDWFFYSPKTDLSLQDVLYNIKWIQSHKLDRVNTLGRNIEAPFVGSSIRLVLESPFLNDKREWVVVPNLRSSKFGRLKIKWRYRTLLRKREAWTAWSLPTIGGFTFDPQLKYESFEAVDISVTVSDWHNEPNTASTSACITNHGKSLSSCTTDPLYYTLGDNYPDPFNPRTTISFELPKAGFTTLNIYDALGRRVSTLLAGDLPKGTHSASWDAAASPNGLYFYVLQSGLFRKAKEMVLLR